MARPALTRAHRALLGVVAAGACLISGIGFAGSYNAVRDLAMQKGFGAFSYAFPIGVDAGIVVLLSLDLVLTWLRIPFPLLRQTAWLLTAATIAFNAAASWGDPLGMSMHAVIPVLFVVVVEASRHAVGRMAAITADRYMESVRLMRWVLSPVPTFRLWRRMKLWELRSYDETVRLEQNRLVYRAQLRFRYGRGWRRSAPFQALLPLKLAKYGVPLDPSVLDRIDGPLQAQAASAAMVQQGAQPVSGEIEAGERPAGPAVPTVSAAVAVPTLAKLAALRLRDAQEPEQAAAPMAAAPAGDLNVWTARAVRTHVEQPTVRVPGQGSPWFKSAPGAEAADGGPVPAQAAAAQSAAGRAGGVPRAQGAPAGQAPAAPRGPVQGADAAMAGAAGQAARPAQPVQGRPGQSGPTAAAAPGSPGRPVPAQGPAGQGQDQGQSQDQGRPVPAQAGSDEEFPEQLYPLDGPGGAFDEAGAAPIRIGHRPVRLDGEVLDPQADEARRAVFAEPLTFDDVADVADVADADERGAGRRLPGEPLDSDACFNALLTYLETYQQQPTEQRFAEYLTQEWGMTGSRPDGSVGAKDLEKIWPDLRDRYMASGRAE